MRPHIQVTRHNFARRARFILILSHFVYLEHYHSNRVRCYKMNIESWCQVEGNSNQKWTRSTRKHYEHALRSTVFQEEKEKSRDDSRVDWSTANKPDQNKLAKKKHFQQKCKLPKKYTHTHTHTHTHEFEHNIFYCP